MRRHLKTILSGVLFLALVGGTIGVLAGRAESAAGLQGKALTAIASIGPVRVTAIDEVPGENGAAYQVEVTQLLDKKSSLERETVVDQATGRTVSDRSVVGNEITGVDYKVNYVSHYVGLQAPASLLTLWGGYEELLAEGKPVEVSDAPDGLHRLVISFDQGVVTIYLGSEYLPVRIEFSDSSAPRSPSRTITYKAIDVTQAVSPEQIRIGSLPPNPLVVESHRILPTQEPRITERVPFGQYWLGTAAFGRALVRAEHLEFSPRPDYEPLGINGLLLIYQAEGADSRDKEKDIQLTCHPLEGDVAESDVSTFKTKAGEPDYRLWQRDVAGQQAQILVQTHPENGAEAIRTLVFLKDAVLELDAHLSLEELEKVLGAVKPLT